MGSQCLNRQALFKHPYSYYMIRSVLYPYDSGFTPWMASRLDQRFLLSLYVPHSLHAKSKSRLLVLVHGTSRCDWLRQSFQDFSERTGTILLAPLFPILNSDCSDMNAYKWMHSHGFRYDLLLLDMIEQAASIWDIDFERFALFGFSGGGQFAHRFLYLYPERLSAVSIGAPGNVSLPDLERDWPAGVGNLEERFGMQFDIDEVRTVPTHLVIGDADTETFEIVKHPEDPIYISGVNDQDTNRIERISRLRSELCLLGSSPVMDYVKGVSHQGAPLVPSVVSWLETVVAKEGCRLAG